MGSSPDLAKLSNELSSLLADSVKIGNEWQGILKEVEKMAFEVLCDPDKRKTLLDETGGSSPFVISNLCNAILESERIKQRAAESQLQLGDLHFAMVMLPRSIVNKAINLLLEVGITGKELQRVRTEFAHFLLYPSGVATIYSRCTGNELDGHILTAAFSMLENQTFVPLYVEAGINVKEFYMKTTALKQKYCVT